MTAIAERLFCAPIAGLVPIDVDEANVLLERWEHDLGPCNRPFGQEAWVLDIDGRSVSVAISASIVSDHVTTGGGVAWLRSGRRARPTVLRPGRAVGDPPDAAPVERGSRSTLVVLAGARSGVVLNQPTQRRPVPMGRLDPGGGTGQRERRWDMDQETPGRLQAPRQETAMDLALPDGGD